MKNWIALYLFLLSNTLFAQQNKLTPFASNRFEIQNYCLQWGSSYLFFGQQGAEIQVGGEGNQVWLLKSDQKFNAFQSQKIATHDTIVYPWTAIPIGDKLYLWSLAKLNNGKSFPCVWVLDSNLDVLSVRNFMNCLPSDSAVYKHLSVVYSPLDSQFVANCLVIDKQKVSNDYVNNYLFTFQPNSNSIKDQRYELKDTMVFDEFLEGSGINVFQDSTSVKYFIVKRVDFNPLFFPYPLSIQFYDKDLNKLNEMVPSIAFNELGNWQLNGQIGDNKVLGNNCYSLGFIQQLRNITQLPDSNFFFIHQVNLKNGDWHKSQFTKKFAVTNSPNFWINSRPAINQSIDFQQNNFIVGANFHFDNFLEQIGQSVIVIAKYDTALNLVWEKHIENKNFYLSGVKALANGGCIAYGTYKNSGHPEQEPDAFLYVFDEFGNATGTNPMAMGSENEMLIYPNPAQTNIHIEGINFAQSTSIKVVNLNGQTVLQSSNCNELDICGLCPGFYILNIETKDACFQKKFYKN